jgi:aspartyl-tRNA(Asn)/glutamyl-tRNA(Gln) amidotransferase subunit A
MKELIGKSINELRELLLKRQVSAREILKAHLSHIEGTESDLHAFITITDELAYKLADKVDASIAAGDEQPTLAGIPIAIKDNISLTGYATTAASKMLENYVPPYQATVIEKLIDAGAVIIGKTNLDDCAMGSSTENSAFGPTHNPYDLKRVSGGSSGGSAAAVAAGQAVVALGSDTGGSVRQPAALCGVVGMKPTYGLVSRWGLVAFASSLDQIGPFARTTEDAALTLSIISGHDQRDSTSIKSGYPDLLKQLDAGIKGMRVGVIKELMEAEIDAEVATAIKATIKVLQDLGAVVDEVSLPNSKHALPVYYIIASAEASANLARYDGVKYGYSAPGAKDMLSLHCATREEGFGLEVRRRIMLGTYALSSGYYDAYYKKAQQVRRLIKDDFDRAFSKHDVLLSPTSPTTAFEIGAKADDPIQMYLSDIATLPAPLAGIPGISIPCGFDGKRLPIGLQLLGPALGDAVILKTAHAFEKATSFHKQPPPILTKAAVGS